MSSSIGASVKMKSNTRITALLGMPPGAGAKLLRTSQVRDEDSGTYHAYESMLCFKGEHQMLKWLCYDDSAIFYVVATTREEAAAFAAQYDGHVVCAVPVVARSGVRAA